MRPIIDAAELKEIIDEYGLILIDASGGPNAHADYTSQHLAGAQWVDLETQLAEIEEDVSLGGRHPLPSLKRFSVLLGELGITPESHVVIYDHMNGANAASRFWWMLRSVGHEKVQVLNGGFKAAQALGLPIDAEGVEIRKAVAYPLETWLLPMVDITEVEEISQQEDHRLIDVRSAERYRGETEPIDLVAGHIPGAINIPLTENLDANGLFLSPEALKTKYSKALEGIDADKVIIHCGSGVTACHTILAMDYAGMAIPNLYVGSWSEWSRNEKEMVLKD
ncbi:sulfurtransferase [Reichenbachiella ulvae]|uniref:Sulfurtransferase n=1 Tax=Reichenbachiella ulvae TaxID=2980104 RepID=A0ABT3CZF8_9BACT|nr:sulfurtransferase [Reichenbachiella ulvae]MCV9388875.1 sulfurtransferase [Reichenbachiella ulvae]